MSIARVARRAFSAAAGAAEAYPSYARAAFLGKLAHGAVYPYAPASVLSADQKDTLKQLVDATDSFFATQNDAAKNDATSSIPPNVQAALREMGAYGLQVPEEHGGLGLSNTGYARLVEVVGAHDLGVGIHLGAHQSIGFKGILLFGTPEQKAKYLPKLATGEHVAAFSLTEPSTGSDANSVRTRAVWDAEAKVWRLSGGKLWISNGASAHIYTVFAQTEVEDPVTKEKKDKVTAFIVERTFGGVTAGPPEKKMGIRCSETAEVYFDNTPVPAENVLGKVGGGFKVAMEILNNGRFGMGAALTGTCKASISGATEHANTRVQFGKRIREYGVIQSKIAAMASRTYAVESMAYLLAANMDRGATDYLVEAAISKIFASETAWFVADEAIQILGGLGFMQALPFERRQRDLRIFRIFEGTNDILRLLVAGSGLQTAGKELEPLSKAMKAPAANLGTLLPFAGRYLRSGLGMHPKLSVPWAPSQLAEAAGVIEAATSAFGDTNQHLLIAHGKKLIDQQMALERVADIAIDITASTAVLARATAAIAGSSPTAEHETALANLFVSEAAGRIRGNLEAVRLASDKWAKASITSSAAAYAKAFLPAAQRVPKLKRTVAEQVFEAGGYHATAPLGF